MRGEWGASQGSPPSWNFRFSGEADTNKCVSKTVPESLGAEEDVRKG